MAWKDGLEWDSGLGWEAGMGGYWRGGSYIEEQGLMGLNWRAE